MKRYMTPSDPRFPRVVAALMRRTGAVKVTSVHESVGNSGDPKCLRVFGGECHLAKRGGGWENIGTFYVGACELQGEANVGHEVQLAI